MNHRSIRNGDTGSGTLETDINRILTGSRALPRIPAVKRNLPLNCEWIVIIGLIRKRLRGSCCRKRGYRISTTKVRYG